MGILLLLHIYAIFIEAVTLRGKEVVGRRQLTDLYALPSETNLVFTVGVYKGPTYAKPHNHPKLIESVLTGSEVYTTFSGKPFISYH